MFNISLRSYLKYVLIKTVLILKAENCLLMCCSCFWLYFCHCDKFLSMLDVSQVMLKICVFPCLVLTSIIWLTIYAIFCHNFLLLDGANSSLLCFSLKKSFFLLVECFLPHLCFFVTLPWYASLEDSGI